MIIGFVGRAGSGKNTAATRLAQIVDREVEFVAFADKLKESAAATFGIEPRHFDWLKNDSTARVTVSYIDKYTDECIMAEVSVREYLQRYGTEGHREIFGTDFWVDQALGLSIDRPNMLFVTDVRFDNEVWGIHSRGGIVVEILGLHDPEITDRTHASELPLLGSDYLIDNTTWNDKFATLDGQLYDLAIKFGLPLREAA